VNRRDLLGTLAAASLAPTLNTPAAAAGINASLPPALAGPRMNFAQADKIMAELGLDALILGQSVNLRHATGLWPVVARMGFPASTFAVVTRNADAPVALVSRPFTYYYNMADAHTSLSLPAYLYAAPFTAPDGSDIDSALNSFRFGDYGEAPVDAIESARIATTRQAISEYGTYGTLSAALAAALRVAGVSAGRVAIDHPAAAVALAEGNAKLTTVDADDALRRIRPVKSPVEIALMRYAAAGNIAAAREALASVESGGSYRELRTEFFAAAARRGQRGVFMVIDRSSDEQFDAPFRDGQAFLIDCVSEYEGYHGDYGRTVFIGEPARSMVKATKAMADGWDRVREQLKPGVKFAEIQALGATAITQAGSRYRIPFNPHSVGLYHTDHFGLSGLPPVPDMTLEPGTIISVDCPLMQSGIGGSAHLEDLMLITADGSEPIHDIGDQTITV
jgi:Xaa-Pro aminopeptidase